MLKLVKSALAPKTDIMGCNSGCAKKCATIGANATKTSQSKSPMATLK